MTETRRRDASRAVLLTLSTAVFLMALDSSVMNVSIKQVAADLGTTVTGIQTAITLYTLVMASFMLLGGKIGDRIGRKRAFQIGCVIYGCGSLGTALSPTLGWLIFSWSFLEGIGAVLILPATVALVATNVETADRPKAYGSLAAAGAIALAVGPLIGGLVTTLWSWRWVFAAEVLVVLVILVLSRRVADERPERPESRLDLVGAALSAGGLALLIFGVLRSGAWGWVRPVPGGPTWLGLSPVVWLILAGAALIIAFFAWEPRVAAAGREPLLDVTMLDSKPLSAGLNVFFFQRIVMAGLFFTVPLFLSVVLGLSAAATGVRLLPMSLALFAGALGVPRIWANGSPRAIVRNGTLLVLAGVVALIASLELGAGPEIVFVPMLLAGLGIGAQSSQLGNITVSAVPERQSAQVGGLQNTYANLGMSMGTALAGSVLIAALTSTLLTGLDTNPAVPDEVVSQATVELAAGVPFVSDTQLETALDDAGVPPDVATAVTEENADARLVALRTSLAVIMVLALVSLWFVRRLPDQQPSAEST